MTEQKKQRSVSYLTKQKTAVLEFLKGRSGEYLSIAEIQLHLRESFGRIGYTTIYRILTRLTEEGICRRFVAGKGDPVLFEYAPDPQEAEFHIQCKCCKRMFHLHCGEIARMAGAVTAHLEHEHSVSIDFQSSILQGVCASCRKKAGKA